MRPLEKTVLFSLGSVFIAIAIAVVALILTYEEPAQYTAPCRTVGHLQIPEEECGR